MKFFSKKRAIIYSTILTIGFVYLEYVLEKYLPKQFLLSSLFLYLVLLFELLSTRYHARHLLIQFSLNAPERNDHGIHYIHHAILPSLTYFSIVLFIFFAPHQGLSYLIYLSAFLLFYILFINIRAFYEDKFILEEKTHSIYDILNIFLVFLATYGILSLGAYLELSVYLTITFLAILFITLNLITLYRYSAFKKLIVIYTTLTVVIACVIVLGLLLIGIQPTILALIPALFFYVIIAYLNHFRDGTISLAIISEYAVVILLFIVIIMMIYV